MANYNQPLPFRRLIQFCNGLWDENRKTFYPFNITTSTLNGKRSVMYYVKTVHVSGINTGDKAAGYVTWTVTIRGVLKALGLMYVPTTVAASNVNASQTCAFDVNLLMDENTPLTLTTQVTASHSALIYAEIPVDSAGQAVVVQ